MNRNPLGALRVTSPCSEGWERMIGDDRIRHCEQCDKNVFDLSRFSRDEAETLVGAFRGEFCIRLTRRPDGSIVTSEAETPAAAAFVPIKLRRAGPVAGAALGLVLGVSGAAYAQEPVEIQPVADKPAVVALASKDEVTQSEGAFASVRGTIWGNEFTPTLANVSLVDASTGKFFKTETSANGDYSFTNVPAGEFFLFIEVEHFYPVVKRRVLAAGQVWRANALVDQADVDVMGISGVDRSPRPFSLLRHSDAVAYAKIAKMTEIGSEKYEGENGNPPVEFVNWRMVVQLGNLLKGKGLPTDLAVEQSFIRDETSQPKPGDEVLLFLDGNQGEWRLDTFVQLDAKFHGSPRLADFIQRTRKRTPTRAEFTEWLVQETVNLETRADASFELWDEFPENHVEDTSLEATDYQRVSQRDFLEGWRSDPFRLSTDGPDFLNESQKERLAQALFNTETLEERDENLLRMVENFHHPKRTSFLANQLRNQLAVPSRFTERIFEFLGKSSRDERIQRFAELYRLVEESKFSTLNPNPPDPEACDPAEKEKQLTAARDQAREELRAVIRAALWAYDHPETP